MQHAGMLRRGDCVPNFGDTPLVVSLGSCSALGRRAPAIVGVQCVAFCIRESAVRRTLAAAGGAASGR
jgi:hypothetical protein